jgi:hypothetical protein
MKRWRIAHGQGTTDSYMARKARERREAIQNVANGLGEVVQTNDDGTYMPNARDQSHVLMPGVTDRRLPITT